jgi:hypothetical protein
MHYHARPSMAVPYQKVRSAILHELMVGRSIIGYKVGEGGGNRKCTGPAGEGRVANHYPPRRWNKLQTQGITHTPILAILPIPGKSVMEP